MQVQPEKILEERNQEEQSEAAGVNNTNISYSYDDKDVLSSVVPSEETSLLNTHQQSEQPEFDDGTEY